MPHSIEFNLVCNHFLSWFNKNHVSWIDPKLQSVDTDYAGVTPPPLQKLVNTVDPNVGAALKKMVSVLSSARMMSRPHQLFYLISKDCMRDGVNWGRIVVYLIFAAEYALTMKRIYESDAVVWLVADWTAEFLEGNVKEFVTKNGGWKHGLKGFADLQVEVQGVVRNNHTPLKNGQLPTAYYSIRECLFSSVTNLFLW